MVDDAPSHDPISGRLCSSQEKAGRETLTAVGCVYPINDSFAGPEQLCQFESKSGSSKWDSPGDSNLDRIQIESWPNRD
jgi:hypothetical protein